LIGLKIYGDKPESGNYYLLGPMKIDSDLTFQI